MLRLAERFALPRERSCSSRKACAREELAARSPVGRGGLQGARLPLLAPAPRPDLGRAAGRLMAGRRAVVLLSGGLDSATALAVARAEGFECYALSFDYGQRHARELESARRVAAALGATEHLVLRLDLRAIGGSALTADIPVPKGAERTRPSAHGHPGHLRPGAEHHLPEPRAGLGRGARARRTSSSASMCSTPAAIPTAGPSSSRPSSAWPTSPPRPASRAGAGFRDPHAADRA